MLKTYIQNKTHEFYYKVVKLKDTTCTNQIRKFRVRSAGEYNYIIVTHSYDANAILVRLLKSW